MVQCQAAATKGDSRATVLFVSGEITRRLLLLFLYSLIFSSLLYDSPSRVEICCVSLCLTSFNTCNEPANGRRESFSGVKSIVRLTRRISSIWSSNQSLRTPKNNGIMTNAEHKNKLLIEYALLRLISYKARKSNSRVLMTPYPHHSHQSKPSNSPAPLKADVSWMDHCLFLMSGRPRASDTYAAKCVSIVNCWH